MTKCACGVSYNVEDGKCTKCRILERAEALDAMPDVEYCNYSDSDWHNSEEALLARKKARLKRERKQAKRLEVPDPRRYDVLMVAPCGNCGHLMREHKYGSWAGCAVKGCSCQRGHAESLKERKQKHR